MNENQLSECAKRLKTCREENHYTLEEIGNKLGLHKSTILRWENGETEKIKNPILKELAELYNVNIAWLMGYDVPIKIKKNKKSEIIKIPVIKNITSAEAILTDKNIIDYEELPENEFNDGKYFGLKINDNSMFPRILERDVVIVRQQNDYENGQIVVVLVNDDKATVKQIKKNEKGIILMPFNTQKYEPIFFTNEECKTIPVKIIGVVKRLIGYNFD